MNSTIMNFRHLLGFFFLCFGVVGSITVAADDITEMSLEDLVEAEVEIASLFKESPLNAGSTVTKVDESYWNIMGARRTMGALGQLPGTMILQTLGGGQSVATRGFSMSPFIRGDAFLLDGIPLNNQIVSSSQYFANNVPLGLLQSMEMIRGPGSALYGSDAFHSVIAMKTWSPKENMDQGRVKAGSFHYTQTMVRSSRELPGDWRMTMAGETRHQNNAHVRYHYDDRQGLPRDARYQNDFRSTGGFVRLNNEHFKFMYLEHEIRNKEYSGISPSALFRSGNQGNGEGRFRVTQAAYQKALTGDLELNVMGYYWDSRGDLFFGSNDGAPTNLFHQQFDLIRAGGDVKFKRPAINTPMQWVAGYSYSYSRVVDAQRKLDGLIPQQAEKYRGEVTAINSLFFNADIDLDDESKWNAVLGGRVDFYSHYGSETSPRLGFIYHPEDDASVKILYGQAFRAPSSVERKGSLVIQQNRMIKPESVETIELIFMKRSRKFHLTSTAFTSKIDNLVRLNPTPTAVALAGLTHVHANSGGGISRGFEQELEFKLDRVTLTASASTQRAKISRPSTEYYVSFPKWIGNLGMQWDRSEDLTVRLQGRWMQGWHTGNTANSPNLRSYHRFDMGFKKRLPTWNKSTWLEFDVQNLTGRNNIQSSVVSIHGGLPDERIRFSLRLLMLGSRRLKLK